MRLKLALALALALVVVVAVVADPPDPEVVANRLGSDDPKVRQQAEHDLLHMGSEAQAALMSAAASKDPEISARAKAILADLLWPDAGAAVVGLRLAVRAEKSYAAGQPVCLHARLINDTDKEITVVGAQTPEPDESETFLLDLDGGGDLHMCFRSSLPLPGLPEKFVVPAKEWVAFEFYPENWCAQQAHSKCCPVDLTPGQHTLKLAFNPRGAPEGAWKGRADSNEVKFTLEK